MNNYIDKIIETRRECNIVSREYVYTIEKMCSLLRHLDTHNSFISKEEIEKIEEMCIDIECKHKEIINFENVL